MYCVSFQAARAEAAACRYLVTLEKDDARVLAVCSARPPSCVRVLSLSEATTTPSLLTSRPKVAISTLINHSFESGAILFKYTTSNSKIASISHDSNFVLRAVIQLRMSLQEMGLGILIPNDLPLDMSINLCHKGSAHSGNKGNPISSDGVYPVILSTSSYCSLRVLELLGGFLLSSNWLFA